MPRRSRCAPTPLRPRAVLQVESLEIRNLLDAGAASLLRIDAIPNDTSFSTQWALNNTGQGGGVVDADIDAPEAWNVTTGSISTVVAVIDTGIDYRHIDLYRNIWINQGEIPTAIRSRLIDIDSDGLITFWDLADKQNQGSGKVIDGNKNGRIDAWDLLQPVSKGGWEDNLSNDGDAFRDDIIGWDFVNNDNDPLDDNDHGTHVAGIIGATGGDGVGVTGVAPKVQLMAVKTLGANGTGFPSSMVAGLNYAVAHGAQISNNSYGGGEFDQAMFDAIDAARAMGHIFVASAGNGGSNYVGDDLDTNPVFPGSYNLPNVVTVTATTRSDTLPVYSNTGKLTVDLGAPGREILSTARYEKYKTFSGTSMAAPMVTGVLALLKSEHQDWQYHQIIDQVLTTTDPIAALAGKSVSGGRLNAYRALTEIHADTTGAQLVTAVPDATGTKPVSSLRVTFSEAIDPASFDLGDIISLTGPTGAIAPTQIVPVANSDGRSFDVLFLKQTLAGTYSLQLGSGINDLFGNPMAHGYIATFNIEPIYTYTSTTKVAIRDVQTSLSTIVVDQDISIADLNVRIDLKHTFDNDLYIHLRGPDGTDVVLANRRGGRYDNYTNTVFDDEATKGIDTGAAPFSGTFRPETFLSAFDGKNARGTWTLIIEDRQSGDTGTLNSWSLTIENAPPTPTATQTLRMASVEDENVFEELVGESLSESRQPSFVEEPHILAFPIDRQTTTPLAPAQGTLHDQPMTSPELNTLNQFFTVVQRREAFWSVNTSEAKSPTLEELIEFFTRRNR